MPKLAIKFDPKAWEEFTAWAERDPKMARRIVALIDDMQSNPFKGIGKPEPLRHAYHGFWSRRIDDRHRLVYCVLDDAIAIVRCYGHYDD